MLKFAKIYLLVLPGVLAVCFTACTSGEYEATTYKINYTEKTVKADTIKKITLNDDKIKQDKNNSSYSFVVQIGAFSIQSNFENFLARAKQLLGDDVYYEQSGNLFKIRIGKFSNRIEAVKLAEISRSKGFTDAFIITKKN